MSESKVAVIRGRAVLSQAGELSQQKVGEMFRRGFQILMGAPTAESGLAQIFARNDRVGIKINTIGGPKISTRPEVSLTLADLLVKGGLQERNIIIWDRTNRELKEAGYRLSSFSNGLKVFGTDMDGAGYETELESHLNIGSLLSTIQTNFVTASISLAILKDHGLAGVTAGMKNYFGCIHNPNKYHDSRCDPYVAEVFDLELIKRKHKLSILDCLVVQYHRGPSFHPQWAEPSGVLVFSLDPVAADSVGWRLIDQLRAKKGLPSLQEDGREPIYLRTAEKMGLGRARIDQINIIEDEV